MLNNFLKILRCHWMFHFMYTNLSKKQYLWNMRYNISSFGIAPRVFTIFVWKLSWRTLLLYKLKAIKTLQNFLRMTVNLNFSPATNFRLLFSLVFYNLFFVSRWAMAGLENREIELLRHCIHTYIFLFYCWNYECTSW